MYKHHWVSQKITHFPGKIPPKLPTPVYRRKTPFTAWFISIFPTFFEDFFPPFWYSLLYKFLHQSMDKHRSSPGSMLSDATWSGRVGQLTCLGPLEIEPIVTRTILQDILLDFSPSGWWRIFSRVSLLICWKHLLLSHCQNQWPPIIGLRNSTKFPHKHRLFG